MIETPARAKKFHGLPQGVNKFDRVLFVLYDTKVRGSDEFLVRVSSERGVTFDEMGDVVLCEGEGMDYIRSSIVMWRMAFGDFETDLEIMYDRPYLDSAKIQRVPEDLSNHTTYDNT